MCNEPSQESFVITGGGPASKTWKMISFSLGPDYDTEYLKGLA